MAALDMQGERHVNTFLCQKKKKNKTKQPFLRTLSFTTSSSTV